MAMRFGRTLPWAVLLCCTGGAGATGEDGNAKDVTAPGAGRRSKPGDEADESHFGCAGPDPKRLRSLPPCNICEGDVEAETLTRCLPPSSPTTLRRWCGRIVHDQCWHEEMGQCEACWHEEASFDFGGSYYTCEVCGDAKPFHEGRWGTPPRDIFGRLIQCG